MARREATSEDALQWQGFKLRKRLIPLFEDLRDVGCERDRAVDRCLFYDQDGLIILLYLFKPIPGSLRSLQQASPLESVQRTLGGRRVSLGSLSEAVEVFEPDPWRIGRRFA